MSESLTIASYTDLLLPPQVVSKIDVSSLVTDAERLDNEMTTFVVRSKTSSTPPTKLTASEQLADFLRLNKITIKSSHECGELVKQLRLLKEKAPVLHMTFAVTADQESLQLLVQWLRGSVHPQALLIVGLQPALVAGAYVRTPNHVLDLSLRAKLTGSRNLLAKELETLRAGNQ